MEVAKIIVYKNRVTRIVLLFLCLACSDAFSQELLCKIIIDDNQVQTQERQIFKDMQTAFTQFMNNRRWTNETYKPEERIRCNIQLTLNPTNQLGSYSARAKIQSSRPIFGTNYESLMMNYVDKSFQFEYVQSQPLDYSDNTVTSNLTAMLSFYAYIIIGLDQDSFSPLGGTPYFQKAQNILNMAAGQFNNIPGWQAFGNDNQSRYWLMENMLSPALTPIREALYNYHRLALDAFDKDPEGARTKIVDALTKIKTANAQKRMSVLFSIFFDAKKTELINIFSQGNMQPRKQAYDLLVELDPVNASKYKKIVEG
jgi:hypothetical protein